MVLFHFFMYVYLGGLMKCSFIFEENMMFETNPHYQGFWAVYHPSQKLDDIFWMKVDNENEIVIIHNLKTGGEIWIAFEYLLIIYSHIYVSFSSEGKTLFVGDVALDWDIIHHLKGEEVLYNPHQFILFSVESADFSEEKSPLPYELEFTSHYLINKQEMFNN